MAGSQWHGYWDRRRLSVKRKEVSQSENDEIGAGTEKSSPSIVAPDLVDVYEFICRHVFLSSICWLFLLFFPRQMMLSFKISPFSLRNAGTELLLQALLSFFPFTKVCIYYSTEAPQPVT
jgi:hypothetical protein